MLLMDPENEGELAKYGFRTAVKLRLKKMKKNLDSERVDESTETSAFEEDDMFPTGEACFSDRLNHSLATRTREEIFRKAFSLVSLPTLCIQAAVAVSDDALLAVFPSLSRNLPVIANKIATSSSIMWIGAAAVLTVQTVFHTYRFYQGKITWQQLAKYTAVNAVSGAAGVGGGIGGGAAGAAIGTLIFPGVGTIVGGVVGSILGALLMGGIAQIGGSYIGNKIVNDEEHFKIAERKRQYKKALELFGMKESEVTRYAVEKKKKALFKLYHPDKYEEEKKQKAHEKFLAVCAMYYIIMIENKYIDVSDAQLLIELSPVPSQI